MCDQEADGVKPTAEIARALRTRAEQSSTASKMLANAKTQRNRADGEPDAFYAGGEPHQMLEWKAADEIERLSNLHDELVEALRDLCDRADEFPLTQIDVVAVAAKSAINRARAVLAKVKE